MCWPASSSIISRFSRQTKSTRYSPIGTCLLNLNPSLLARREYHRCLSASVLFFLKSRARCLSTDPLPNPQWHLLKNFECIIFRLCEHSEAIQIDLCTKNCSGLLHFVRNDDNFFLSENHCPNPLPRKASSYYQSS
jgi:hypothetical protein